MRRRTTKILTDVIRKMELKRRIKRIKKIINSDILWASSSGFYKVKIWDFKLAECLVGDTDKINETLEYVDNLKEYYEKRGFRIFISPSEPQVHRYIEISWENNKE